MSEERSASPENPHILLAYTDVDIEVLRGLEHVRYRPGVYLGSTDQSGLQNMIRYLLHESLELFAQGLVQSIGVRRNLDGSWVVQDDGPPLSLEVHSPRLGKTTLELLLTEMGASRVPPTSNSYRTRVGLHGIELPVVNALSESLLVEVCGSGQLFRQQYRCGNPLGPPEHVGPCSETGLSITFRPDPTIFSTTTIDFQQVRSRLFEVACLQSGLRVVLEDESAQTREQFHFHDGIQALFGAKFAGRFPLYSEVARFSHKEEDFRYEVAFCHSNEEEDRTHSYAVGEHTRDGGSHVTAFRSALTRSFRMLLESAENSIRSLPAEHYRAGLVAVIAVWVPEPRFGGAEKHRLLNPELEGSMADRLGKQLLNYWRLYPEVARAILRNAQESHSRSQAHRPRRQRRLATG